MADLVATQELTRYLHDHIPLTRHMGIVVTECSGERVVLSAPLEPNVNHRETAFGGSLSGAAILAGWTWLHARLLPCGHRHRLVIHESVTHFENPVEGPFEAVCDSPPADEFDRFLTMFNRRGKARLTLESRILCGETVAARHTGRYVALRGA
ncbi:MAG: YiiD C-terminal domain-containing protein [Planctomycetaceae bacterium]